MPGFDRAFFIGDYSREGEKERKDFGNHGDTKAQGSTEL